MAVDRSTLWAPFAFLAALASLATFYLARFGVPIALGLVALGLAIFAHVRVRPAPHTRAAMAVAGAALVVSLAYAVLS